MRLPTVKAIDLKPDVVSTPIIPKKTQTFRKTTGSENPAETQSNKTNGSSIN